MRFDIQHWGESVSIAPWAAVVRPLRRLLALVFTALFIAQSVLGVPALAKPSSSPDFESNLPSVRVQRAQHAIELVANIAKTAPGGFGALGGISYGSSQRSLDGKSAGTTAVHSTVGSLSGNAYTQVGSDLSLTASGQGAASGMAADNAFSFPGRRHRFLRFFLQGLHAKN